MRNLNALAAITFLAAVMVCPPAQASTGEPPGVPALEQVALLEHPHAMVFAVRHTDPMLGDVATGPVVVFRDAFAGYAAPHLPGVDRNPRVITASCGGMPG